MKDSKEIKIIKYQSLYYLIVIFITLLALFGAFTPSLFSLLIIIISISILGMQTLISYHRTLTALIELNEITEEYIIKKFIKDKHKDGLNKPINLN